MKKLFKTLAAGLLLVSSQAFAALINYEINGVGSGSLNGVAFNEQSFTFSLQGDTANFTSPGFYESIDPLNSASVSVNGVGSTTFLIPTRLGIAGNAVFFSREGGGGLDLFDFIIDNPVDLTTSFGPVAGYNVFALNQFVDVQTSLGLLTFSAADSVTFSAAVVPEPETYALMLGGLGMTALVARRRRQRAAA